MDKNSLDTLSKIWAYDIISENKPKKDESLEDYVKRVYPKVDERIEKASNPVIAGMAKDFEVDQRNAAFKVGIRKAIVEAWAKVNDPGDIPEQPEEATDDEILKLNGFETDAKTLKATIGEEAYNNVISKLKTPAKKGISETERRKRFEDHCSEIGGAAYPTKKQYTHGSGGETYDYKWEKDMQDLYVEDHENFLKEYGLTDIFQERARKREQAKKEEAEKEKEKEESKGKKSNKK